jgi:hypothetical protein
MPPSRQPIPKTSIPLNDSGYHGSQSQDSSDGVHLSKSPRPVIPAKTVPRQADHVAFHSTSTHNEIQSPTRTKIIQSPEHTFHTAREEQTTKVMPDMTQKLMAPIAETRATCSPAKDVPASPTPITRPPSPTKVSPSKASSPLKSSPAKMHATRYETNPMPEAAAEPDNDVDLRSPSDGSSPIRPVVRKSSLNFASLPAREPLTTNKSIGGRISRTSHLDQNRKSYYGRPTGGKSLGTNIRKPEVDDHDEMDIDDLTVVEKGQDLTENLAINHNKTYTQRLQDQINKLGKSQPSAANSSKSIPNIMAAQQVTTAPQSQPATEVKSESPSRKPVSVTTPGAFPEDDEDDWIDPPATQQQNNKNIFSPRPAIPKSYTADVMEGIHSKETVSGVEFVLPRQRQQDSRPSSPARTQAPMIPERTTSTFGHNKSASVSVPTFADFGLGRVEDNNVSPKKGISVSNPTLATVSEADRPDTPSKSPSRTFRDSPLKQVKNKLSSILKSSKGLLASSAAISAEGKSSILSPSTTRLGLHAGQSVESLFQPSTTAEQLYPDLSKQGVGAETQTISSTSSPPRPASRRTRASTEREKEAKRKEKDARLFTEQMDKLEKAREKEREKARVFSQEQERVAAMEKQVAAQKEQERPQPTPQQEQPRQTRTSPRKAKAQQEAEARAMAAAMATPATRRTVADEDMDMIDAPASMPPPPAPRSAGPSQGSRAREIKRPTRPAKEATIKTKAAPTVIRVNTGSQHSQFHPSNSVLAANLQDTLGAAPAQHQLNSKASQASLKTKASTQNLKSSVSSNGRPKALELAAKRKEQEEREAQRKREAKAEIERKRAANQEEERRQEQQRRLEAERQKEKEREQAAMQAEAKKSVQRQAAIDRAKQTRAPPPAVRPQPNGQPEYNISQANALSSNASQRAEAQPVRPPSRLTSTVNRSQEEFNRPVNTVLSNATKAASKRPLAQDSSEDSNRNPQSRNGPTYQAKDAKRRRTSEDFNDEAAMENQPPNIKGPPVRPSGGFKKVCRYSRLYCGIVSHSS